jgi:hypothetical protein
VSGLKVKWGNPTDYSTFPEGPFDVVYDNNGKDMDSCKPAIDASKVSIAAVSFSPRLLQQPLSISVFPVDVPLNNDIMMCAIVPFLDALHAVLGSAHPCEDRMVICLLKHVCRAW